MGVKKSVIAAADVKRTVNTAKEIRRSLDMAADIKKVVNKAAEVIFKKQCFIFALYEIYGWNFTNFCSGQPQNL